MKKIKAFSLLESLFSLLLLSFCTTGIIKFYHLSIHFHNESLTKMKANYIRKIIEGYVAMHGFLPYAADSLLGLETDGCVVGYLPYKTLGVNKTYAYDGYGRPFIFVVNENLVLKYNKKDDFIIFPPFFSSVYFFNKSRSWSRLNFYRSINLHKKISSKNDSMFLWDYDDVDNNLNIKLLKNSKEIELSSITIYPILDSESLLKCYTKHELEEFRSYYLVKDLVAWSLISNKIFNIDSLKKNPIIIDLDGFFMVFWQSRFNLAAQIKKPTTTVNTYIGFITSNLIKSCFKHLNKNQFIC